MRKDYPDPFRNAWVPEGNGFKIINRYPAVLGVLIAQCYRFGCLNRAGIRQYAKSVTVLMVPRIGVDDVINTCDRKTGFFMNFANERRHPVLSDVDTTARK